LYRFPKLRVAGSIPVSRSRFLKPLRGVMRGGFVVAFAAIHNAVCPYATADWTLQFLFPK
jgi:hypothetical protein